MGKKAKEKPNPLFDLMNEPINAMATFVRNQTDNIPQQNTPVGKKKASLKTVQDASANSNTSGLMISPMDTKKSATANEDYVISPPDAWARMFAVHYLPLAWRITFGVAGDCWKTGDAFPFSFRREREAELEKVEWSDKAMNVLRDINFFRSGVQQMGIGEMDGEALLILIEEDFDWEKTDVSEPRDPDLKIIDTMAIPMFYVYRASAIKNSEWNLDGTPKYWYINLNAIDGISRPSAKTMKFHHTRVLHYVPDPIDTSTKGLSTLERCWQALVIGFNIDLGTGEAFFRWGIGHPVFETEFDDIKQLKQFMDELGSPNRRTWHALLRGMKLTFAGASGSTLDFKTGKETSVYDEVSIGTQIPRPILKGEVAGVQTGSEVNERSYWGLLRRKQTAYTPIIWKLLAVLTESGQIEDTGCYFDFDTGIIRTPENVIVRWTVHYVETEEQKIDILMKKINTIGPLKDILTINEMRSYTADLLNLPPDALPPLPVEVGGQLLSIFESGAYRVENLIAAQQQQQGEYDPYSEEPPEEGEGGTMAQEPPESAEPVMVGPGDPEPPKGTPNVEKQIVPVPDPNKPAGNPINNPKKEEKAIGKPIGNAILKGKQIVPGVPIKKEPNPEGGARQIVDPRLPSLTNTVQKVIAKVPKMGNPLTAPRKIGQKRRDEEGDLQEPEDTSKIIGCPDHDSFRKNCPACVRVLKYKEDLAKDMLSYGFSVNQVQTFVGLDRNKINTLRQGVVKENEQRNA